MDIKTKIKEVITDNFKPKDVGIGIINGIFSNEDVDRLTDDLVKKLNIDDVSNCLHTYEPFTKGVEICTKCDECLLGD